jgi:hypothetical protein
MLYYVMDGEDIIAICSRAEDAEALARYDYAAQKSYQVVQKTVDTDTE